MNTQGVTTEHSLISAREALDLMTSKTGKGVFASADVRYHGAVFGRDSLEVAEDLLLISPEISKDILITLASLQGTHQSDKQEEQIGKIHHEFRSNNLDHEPLDEIAKLIFDDLSSRWGGDNMSVIYYGSVDATPLFIRVLCRYCDNYGEEFLDTRIINKDGHVSSIRKSLQSAVDYLLKQFEDSPSGLLSYKSCNPLGLQNQAWKDSREFYVHDNGEEVNHNEPVASIEVQGLAYDALMLSKDYLPAKKAKLQNTAQNLRQLTIKYLWLEDLDYFGLGIDQDENGKNRVIKTITANPAELLDTTFFDDMSEVEQRKYVGAIVRKIFSPEFITDAGIRSRGLSHADLVDYWDYHGAYTTWPKETYDISKGLRKFGFNTLAEQLENRLLNAVQKSTKYPEFFYVDKSGRVLFPAPDDYYDVHDDLTTINTTNLPEGIQAWTTSAVLAIKYAHSHPKLVAGGVWQKELQQKLVDTFAHRHEIKSRVELRKQYPDYFYKLEKSKKLPFEPSV